MFIRYSSKKQHHICFLHAVQRIGLGEKIEMMEPFITQQKELVVCPFCQPVEYKVAELKKDQLQKTFLEGDLRD